MYSLGRGVAANHALALQHYHAAAKLGDSHAFNEIGVVYLAGEGVVFLTSSSANEDAHESDTLKGSFFTHYLVSGMLGAADTDAGPVAEQRSCLVGLVQPTRDDDRVGGRLEDFGETTRRRERRGLGQPLTDERELEQHL